MVSKIGNKRGVKKLQSRAEILRIVFVARFTKLSDEIVGEIDRERVPELENSGSCSADTELILSGELSFIAVNYIMHSLSLVVNKVNFESVIPCLVIYLGTVFTVNIIIAV